MSEPAPFTCGLEGCGCQLRSTGPEIETFTGVRLPTDPTARKNAPIARGVLDYFPLALAEIAKVSKAGNDQHNPGEPMRWAREKSNDHADCLIRHLIERGTVDSDGMRHSAKMAWRALALLQLELEAAPQSGTRNFPLDHGFSA